MKNIRMEAKRMVETEIIGEVKDLVAIEAGTDLAEFEGTRVKIAEVKLLQVKSSFNPTGLQDVLKVMTEPVTTIKTLDKDVEVRASELFNLSRSKNNNKLGWSKSRKGALNKFLVKMKCKSPDELVSKIVTIRLREKGTETYLGFIRE
jgi:hypothetical protein